MQGDTLSPATTSSRGERLTGQHSVRLRHFARYTWDNKGLGWSLDGVIDEELASMGLLQPGDRGHGWFISELGKDVFEARCAFDAARRKPHHALASRASRWLERQGRAAWLNRSFELHLKPDQRVLQSLGLGHEDLASVFSRPAGYKVVSRPDVISIVPSTKKSEWNPWILEAKVSRRDFIQDIKNPSKRYAYALLAKQLFYLTPAGLVSEDELPTGCGLVIEIRPGIFSIVKHAAECKPVRSAHINRLLRGA